MPQNASIELTDLLKNTHFIFTAHMCIKFIKPVGHETAQTQIVILGSIQY